MWSFSIKYCTLSSPNSRPFNCCKYARLAIRCSAISHLNLQMSSDELCSICNSMESLYDSASLAYDRGLEVFLPKDKPFIRHVTASCVGSVVTVLSLNPLFVLKVRVQNMDSKSMTTSKILDEAFVIRNQRGLRGFWTGASTALAMSVPNTIVYMTTYEKSKEILTNGYSFSMSEKNNAKVASIIPGIAGAIARFLSVTVVSPFELVRTQQSANTTSDKHNAIQIVKDVVREGGVRALYRGWSTTIWRDCPFSATYWICLEMMRPTLSSITLLQNPTPNKIGNKNINSKNAKEMFSPLVNFISGSLAGTIAAIVTHPFDVIKTKQQLGSNLGFESAPANSNVWKLLKVADIRTLSSGLGLRLLTVIPACGIVITVYETLKHIE